MLNVYLPGTILKPSMVISGQENDSRANLEEVATKTIACLRDFVPTDTAGIAFLSGGQTDLEAESHLNIMNQKMISMESNFFLCESYTSCCASCLARKR